MKPETYGRRMFMLEQYGRSFSLKEAIELTATKFGCEKPSLYTDWARKDKWLKKICNFQKANTHIREIYISFYNILKELDDLIKNADNSNCKLGALKLSINTRFKMIDLLQDMREHEDATKGDEPSTEDKKKPLAVLMWSPEMESYLQAREQEKKKNGSSIPTEKHSACTP